MQNNKSRFNYLSRNIIITVDDFGFDHKANKLIFEAINKKIITQASTMVNMVGSDEALKYIVMSKANTGFGLHLNLTEGEPLCDPKTIPSLVDKNGYFTGWKKLIWRSTALQLRSQDIERETAAQIEKLQSAIKPIPFINSHHHIHLWPSIAKIVLPLCAEYKIVQIRWPRNTRWWSGLTKHGFKALAIQLLPKLHHAKHQSLSSYFFDLDWIKNPDLDQIFNLLPTDSEVDCHPQTYRGRPSTLQLLMKYHD